MFSNLRKRLEDGLDAVEAMAAGNTPGSPRAGRQDSVSSFTDASSISSLPGRQSLDTPSPQAQHSPSFNYLPYQPRAAAQLADSAMSNLRRSLSLQRSASVNSGNSEHSPLERKVSRGLSGTNGGSDREPSPVQAPTPRRPAGISLEERLRANFAIGDASGSPSPARQSTPLAKSPSNISRAPESLEPVNIPLPDSRPSSPHNTATPVTHEFPSGQTMDPTSIHLPTSPPANNTLLSSIHQVSAEPRTRTLSPSAVTLHPLSPPPPESLEQPEHSSNEDTSEEPTVLLARDPQPERVINRPPNIVVDISAPQSTIVTPSDFATAESRSDITDGTPVDNFHVDAINNSLLGLEAQNTPSSAVNELPPDTAPVTEVSIPGAEDHENNLVPDNGPELENDSGAKVQERLKVVEERFNDISTSFKRLQAEKVAADKMIKEVSSLEGLSDLEALRDYMVNQKMKVEISNDEIKRLMGQVRQQEERLEEVREMHKMETSSQSELIEKLRQQLAESEALLKVAESDSTAQKTGLSQHEAEIERLKGSLKDEEEKRVKAITLLKTVRQKLTKAEKDRDDIAKEREKDKEDISAARAEIERVRADAQRAKNERERDIAAMRDRFEKETKEIRERYEKESAARKGQYELDIITMKATHAKELSAKTSRITSLESAVATLSSERDSLFEQSQSRQAEAESAQSHLQTVQNQVSELQYQLKEAEDRNALLVDELDELRNGSRLSTHSPTPGPEVARLLSEAEGKFENRLSEMRMKLRAAEKERNEAEDDWNKTLADRGKEIEKLRFALRQAEDKWLESGRVGKGMDEKVAALEANIKELNAQRDAWGAERLSVTSELKKAQDALSALQNEHSEVLGRITSFETQIEENKNRESYLKTTNKTLRDELRKVQSSAALLERQRPTGVGFWSGGNQPNPPKPGNGVTSPLQSPRPGSPTVSEVGSTSAKQEEEVNLEYIRNVILQFLEHKEMRPNLVRVLSTILRFTPQETRRLAAKV